jgi:hypothetical protein
MQRTAVTNTAIATNFNRRLDELMDNAIDYSSLGKLLLNLGCINEFNGTKDYPKVKEFWDVISEGNAEISKKYVSSALKKILLIPGEESNNLHKEFYGFYINYLANGKTKHVKGTKFTFRNEEYTFIPQISPRSNAILAAKSSRELAHCNSLL